MGLDDAPPGQESCERCLPQPTTARPPAYAEASAGKPADTGRIQGKGFFF